MERRTFVRGAFGLVVVAAGACLGMPAVRRGLGDDAFVTPEPDLAGACPGPAMRAGIVLEEDGDGRHWGSWGDERLFAVDSIGAELIELADGTHSIEDMARLASVPLLEADVASFFVALGQAGYLANTVLVNLVQTTE